MAGGIAYVVVLAVFGYAIGHNWNTVLGVVLAAAGAYLGWGMAKARARRLSRPSAAGGATSPAQPDVSDLPAYKAAYNDLDIVGESYRQDAIRKVWRGAEATHTAVLSPENENPHDSDAVRVEIDGRHVGYLSRDSAEDYREHMGDRSCKIPVHLVKGGDVGTIGVFAGKGSAAKEADKRGRSAKAR